MASTKKVSDDHWIAHLASEEQSEVVVEVHMSRAKAQELAEEDPAGGLAGAVMMRLIAPPR